MTTPSDSLPGDRSGEPPSREPDIKPFTYLLNAMEVAAWAEKPSERGYEVKRKAVFDYVREALRAARGGSPAPTLRELLDDLAAAKQRLIDFWTDHLPNDAERAKIAEMVRGRPDLLALIAELNAGGSPIGEPKGGRPMSPQSAVGTSEDRGLGISGQPASPSVGQDESALLRALRAAKALCRSLHPLWAKTGPCPTCIELADEALRAARGGSPPNTNSPEISNALVVGGSPAGEPDEAAVTLLREELVVTIQKSLPAGAHLLVAEFEAAVRAAPVAHGVQQPRSRQHLGGGGPAEDPTDAEIETLWAWMNGEDDGRVWTQGDARRALLAVRAAASGSARPPEPSEAAVAAAVEAYRRNAQGQYDAHSVELDARQMWSAALQSAYAIDFRGPGAADPLRVAAQALLDALEPLADFYLSEPTQIARRSLRAALSSGAAEP